MSNCACLCGFALPTGLLCKVTIEELASCDNLTHADDGFTCRESCRYALTGRPHLSSAFTSQAPACYLQHQSVWHQAD